MQFRQVSAFCLVFHALQFVVEGELLIAMEVSHTAAEFHGCCDALKQRCQLLHGWLLRIIVIGRGVPLTILVDKFLGAGERQLLVARVDLAREVMGLGGKLEDASAASIGQCEIRLVIVARVGIGGEAFVRDVSFCARDAGRPPPPAVERQHHVRRNPRRRGFDHRQSG